MEENIKKEKKKKKTITKKKLHFFDVDADLLAFLEAIDNFSGRDLYFVLPVNSIIFQSIVNLKILKSKSKEKKKKLYFITDDKNGINLAFQAGIKVYNKSDTESNLHIYSSKSEDEKVDLSPLKASINSIEEDMPTRLSERKLSIGELLKGLDSPKKEKSLKKIKKEAALKTKIKISSPHKGPFVALFAFIFVVLVAVFYIALPSVTVYLTPHATVLEEYANITLADYEKNRLELETHPHNTIASYPIELDVNKEISYTATGKKTSPNGSNAKGKLTIFNDSDQDWTLIPRTRFETAEGIVFRIAEYVNVPAKGSLEVSVEADEKDKYEMIVGERGNIGPSSFILPGLSEENRKIVYAESYEDMTGGLSDFLTFIEEADLDAAEEKLKRELEKEAVAQLKLEIENKEESQNFVLLEGDDTLRIGEADISIDRSLIGAEQEEFKVSGSISVSALYYDRNHMLDILKGELITKKSPNKELLRINEQSTSYKVIDWDESTGKARVTANIKGIEQFEIYEDTEHGEKLLSKIRDHIKGVDKEYAEEYIRNLQEINKVEIESWPAWAPTIPNIEENIKFEVREAITVN